MTEKKKIVLTKAFLLEKGMETPRMILGWSLFFFVVLLALLLLMRILFWFVDKISAGPTLDLTPAYWSLCLPAGIILFSAAKACIERFQKVKALEKGDFFVSIERLGDKFVQGSLPGSPGKKYVLSFTFHDTGKKRLERTSEDNFNAPETVIGAKYYFVRREDRVFHAYLLPTCRYELSEELRSFLVNPEDEA